MANEQSPMRKVSVREYINECRKELCMSGGGLLLLAVLTGTAVYFLQRLFLVKGSFPWTSEFGNTLMGIFVMIPWWLFVAPIPTLATPLALQHFELFVKLKRGWLDIYTFHNEETKVFQKMQAIFMWSFSLDILMGVLIASAFGWL